MSKPSPFADPLLPFPLKIVPSATGPVRIYEIPEEQKESGGTIIDWWPVRRGRKGKRG